MQLCTCCECSSRHWGQQKLLSSFLGPQKETGTKAQHSIWNGVACGQEMPAPMVRVFVTGVKVKLWSQEIASKVYERQP